MTSMRPPRPRSRPRRAPPGAARLLARALALVLACTAAGAAVAPASQERPAQRVDTRIHAAYSEDDRTLDGEVVQVWTNSTADSVADLWFHLYHNAFSNNQSTHLIEAGGSLRGTRMKEGWGWQRVTSVVVGGQELLPTFRYRQPDDGNEADKTVFSVELPGPVAPGESIEVRVLWKAAIPRVRRRTGYKDDFLFLAHWFPKLAVYEEGRGWNCHQFHSTTEFFGNFGTYDVTLDLPAEYEGQVFASGSQVGLPDRRGERVITRFVAPSPQDQIRIDATGRSPLVHAFTWTADPDFAIYRRPFHYDTWANRHEDEVAAVQTALGAEKDLRLREVEVIVLMQPEREAQAERHFEATCAALFFYGLWFGEYPYEKVTVVDPPWGGRAAGGMEYPTLFTAGTRLFTRPDMYTPESVTVHECGHQFWYGLVGNNEFEAAWLDEGFNSYADSETLVRRYGPRRATTDYSGLAHPRTEPVSVTPRTTFDRAISAHLIPLPLVPFDLVPFRDAGFLRYWRDRPELSFVEQFSDPRWSDRSRYLTSADRDAIDTPGWQYVDRSSYSINSYPRPAVALRSLAAAMGPDGQAKFLRGMRHYSEEWRYRHPYPDDFFAAFNEGSGEDMSWYFDEMFRGTGTVDWSVAVSQRRLPEERGFFQPVAGAAFDEVVPDEDEDDDEPEADEDEEDEEPSADGSPRRPWRIEITVERSGTLALPLPVRWSFAGGSGSYLWTREAQLDGEPVWGEGDVAFQATPGESAADEGAGAEDAGTSPDVRVVRVSGSEKWVRIQLESDQRLDSARVDPERGYFVDEDMSNNGWFRKRDKATPWRWAERAFARYAYYLQWQSGFGG